MKYIHESAVVNESEIGDVKLFKNVVVNNSKIADGCSIGDDTTIERCILEKNVAINRRSYINDSFIGSFSYTGINTTMNWTKMGKFCSIARNVDIGGFDHDYHKITTMPEFRFNQILSGGGKIPKQVKHNEYCIVENDVWIAANAQILHKVKVFDGAVVGGGAVVTHDVPPYAIVVGVPARIIGYRCEKQLIDKLLQIQWWNWPLDTIIQNISILLHKDINEDSIEKMLDISSKI